MNGSLATRIASCAFCSSRRASTRSGFSLRATSTACRKVSGWTSANAAAEVKQRSKICFSTLLGYPTRESRLRFEDFEIRRPLDLFAGGVGRRYFELISSGDQRTNRKVSALLRNTKLRQS